MQVIVRGAVERVVEAIPRAVIRGRVAGGQRRSGHGPRQVVPAHRWSSGTGGPESMEMSVNTAVDDILFSRRSDVRTGLTSRPRRAARNGQIVVADRTKRAVQPVQMAIDPR